MLPQEIIRLKRDKKELSESAIIEFIKGVTDETVTDAQISAFTMAVLLNKMSVSERVALMRAMAQSGLVIDWHDMKLDGPIVDKHSTGGLGDKVSLLLAPAVAACGGYVPMIAGRGLGHTGGTIDKLESIQGYNVTPDLDHYKKTVREIGCAIIGQTPALAPADRRIYAVRDTTATVESMDLITASILSKKLAAGLQALVMDIKVGNGAFMENYDDAAAMGQAIVDAANGAGLKCRALITDMNQVLGHHAGNALEILEIMEFLHDKNSRCPRLLAVTKALCGEMLVLGGLAKDRATGEAMIEKTFDDGSCLDRLQRMITAMGGASDFCEKYQTYLPQAAVQKPVYAHDSGWVQNIQTRQLGLEIINLGGGRTDPKQKIDHAVGLSHIVSVGAKIDAKTPLCIVHATSPEQADKIADNLRGCFTIGAKETVNTKLFHGVLS